MADYRTRRIENLKAYVTETYKGLPEECGKMPIREFSDFLDARIEELISRHKKAVDFCSKEKIDYKGLTSETTKFMDFRSLKSCVDTLVDMGALNFDESMPLKGIVKMLKADSAKGTTRIKI